jgi:hypothetical protein
MPYLGPLGEVVRHGASFIASKDGFPIETYNTFREAMESLAWKGRTKHFGSLKPWSVPADMEFLLPWRVRAVRGFKEKLLIRGFEINDRVTIRKMWSRSNPPPNNYSFCAEAALYAQHIAFGH